MSAASPRPIGRLSALALAIACATASAHDVITFDALSAQAQARTAAGLAARTPDAALLSTLRVHGHVDERVGVPSFLWVGDSSPARAVAGRGLDALSLARAQLHALAPLYRMQAADLDTLVVHDEQTLPNGARLVRLRQRIDGIEVFRDSMTLLSDADGRLLAVGGLLRGESTATHARGAPLAQRGFRFDVQAAIAIALDDRGLDGNALAASIELAPARQDDLDYVQHRFPLPAQTGDVLRMASPLRTRPVWFRLPDGLAPAWYIESDIEDADGPHMVAHVVSAKDGTLLFRHSLTVDAAYTYRVWADTAPPYTPMPGPTGRGWHPHPTGTPDGTKPPYSAPSLVTLQNRAFSRNDPWLPPNATTSRGNNVDAFANITQPDGYNAGDIYAVPSAPNTFDHTYDTTLEPGASTSQRMAAVTQLFFVNNWLHDEYYDAGFDEAAGNAQFDNYGRGGLDNDGLRVQGQDVAALNNANMSTPADGGQPRMRMYVFTVNGEVDRDGTIDNAVIAHEWGHYISNRLIGNAGGLVNSMGSSMGEGWGDTHAMLMQVTEDTGPNPYGGTYAMGSYVTTALAPGNSGFGNDGAYFGIRRYPYSIDMGRNPLTFRHIQESASLPAGPPFRFDSEMNSVHNSGEVWASMLWECYAGLLRDSSRLGFEEAKTRMQRYLVAGYKMTPVSPTYLEARDAVLAAIVAEDVQDYAICAAGFARRGAGFGAVSPPRDSTTHNGVTESYASQGVAMALAGVALDDGSVDCDADGILDPGETGLLTIDLRNTGFDPIDDATVTASSATPGVGFPDGASVAMPPTAPFGESAATLPVALAGGTATDAIAIDLSWTAPGLATPGTATVQYRVGFDVIANDSTGDDAESPQIAWDRTLAITSDENTRWQRIALSPMDHRYHGVDAGSLGLSALVSPPLQVSATQALTLAFQHRYRFEGDAATWWDGGVLQLSTDDGATWTNVGAAASDPYDGTLTTEAQNPLGGQPAWSGQSGGWPALTPVTLDLGTAYAGQTVRVRFAIGMDLAAGDYGWDIDNIAIGGIDNTPFPTVVPQRDLCTVAPPAPGQPDLLAASDSGASDDDDITHADPLSFVVACDADTTIVLEASGASAGSAVCADGEAVIDATVAEGTHAIVAFAERNGLRGAGSTALQVVVDRSAAAPTFLIGGAPLPTVTLDGVAEPGASVVVFDGETALCQDIADNAGAWSCTEMLGDGAHGLSAQQTDIAGNISARSAAQVVIVGSALFEDGFESD